MKITGITQQARDKNRVNVFVDGKYRFGLDVTQITDLGVKVGNEYDEADITCFEKESNFGKLYIKALNYCLSRYRSSKEVKDYLRRKVLLSEDYDMAMIDKVFERLFEKRYVDDRRFAEFWVENRFSKKGISGRRLSMELRKKGLSSELINEALSSVGRNDNEEIKKIIAKKRRNYDDNRLIEYLARQGFDYDLIKDSLKETDVN